MKRTVLALVTASALLLPASAPAAVKVGTYAGKFKGSGTTTFGKVTFRVKKVEGKKRVTYIRISGLRWKCSDGSSYKPSDPIVWNADAGEGLGTKDGKFSAAFATFDQPSDRWTFKGKLTSEGKASGSGWWKYGGRGADKECYTDTQKWGAKRKT